MSQLTAGWRTLLFVPAGEDRKLDRARGSAADALIVDLEDAVLEAAKGDAREWLRRAAAWGGDGPPVVVRINGLATEHSAQDLAVVRQRDDIAAVMVPKAQPAVLDALDVAGLPPLVALVETAAGVLDARAIAAHPHVEALMLGSVDLATELGIDLTPDGPELARARGELVLASAAARLPAPIDGVWSAFADDDGLRREARLARALGFGAKACIHPRQLAIVEQVFAPGDEQLRWAREVVDAAAAAERDGKGAVALNGRMIDRPVLQRARDLLARAPDARAGRAGGE